MKHHFFMRILHYIFRCKRSIYYVRPIDILSVFGFSVKDCETIITAYKKAGFAGLFPYMSKRNKDNISRSIFFLINNSELNRAYGKYIFRTLWKSNYNRDLAETMIELYPFMLSCNMQGLDDFILPSSETLRRWSINEPKLFNYPSMPYQDYMDLVTIFRECNIYNRFFEYKEVGKVGRLRNQTTPNQGIHEITSLKLSRSYSEHTIKKYRLQYISIKPIDLFHKTERKRKEQATISRYCANIRRHIKKECSNKKFTVT